MQRLSGVVLHLIRQFWPDTPIVLRGDSHFANPELMALREQDKEVDFLFGLASNKALMPKAEPLLEQVRAILLDRVCSKRNELQETCGYRDLLSIYEGILTPTFVRQRTYCGRLVP